MTTTLELWTAKERERVETELADLERRIAAGKDDHNVIQEMNWEADRLTTYLSELDERAECFYAGHDRAQETYEGALVTYCKRCKWILDVQQQRSAEGR